MTITIKNFGPIESCTYDLDKDLVCIYGGNNIGKSYSMQLVYLLLKSFLQEKNIKGYRYVRRFPQEIVKSCLEIVDSFKKEEKNSTEITKLIDKLIAKHILISVWEPFYESCKNTFESLNSAINDNSTISIEKEKIKIVFHIKNREIECTSALEKIFLVESKNYYHKSRQADNKLSIYVVKGIDNVDGPMSVIVDYMVAKTEKIINFICEGISDVYFLPASRSGIYNGMSAFASIVAELSKNKAFLTKKIELPGLTEPISDYFISLSSNKYADNEKYLEICKEIEDEILKGTISYDKKDNTLVYSNNENGPKWKMTEVSSMVSEIAPIVAFLKYKMDNTRLYYWNRYYGKIIKPVIFIEEPEAHLHPENQVKLISIFVKLINNDVKIILSSHSNYIFNKLNNLVLAQTLDYKKYQPLIMKREKTGSCAQEMEKNELGVTDNNFVDTSFLLMQEREELIEKLMNEEE